MHPAHFMNDGAGCPQVAEDRLTGVGGCDDVVGLAGDGNPTLAQARLMSHAG